MIRDYNALQREGVGVTDSGHAATLIEYVGRERDSYGEAYEDGGYAYMIFQVGNRFFQKEGEESSYYAGDTDWSWGTLTEVFPKTVTKTVYESR